MIGVIGDREAADVVVSALDDAGLANERAPAEALAEAAPEAVVAVGDPALIAVVDAGLGAPVLPVGLDDGLPSVSPEDAPSMIEAYVEGRAATRSHLLLAVEADGERVGTAVFDVMLVRSEPGRISEFSIGTTAGSRFRSDGVVAATPIGSHGYARAAGGPRLDLKAAAVAVVPVAPFGIGTSTWVLDPTDGLELRVERDEGNVSLLIDGAERRRLHGRSRVTLSPDGSLETITPPD